MRPTPYHVMLGRWAAPLCAALLLAGACEGPAEVVADASFDAAPELDASETAPDAALDVDASSNPDAGNETCEAAVTERGWTHCGDEAGRCALIFEDSTGCTAACAALGLHCAESHDDDADACGPLAAGAALGCRETGHISDYCVCSAEPPPSCGPTPAASVHLIGDSTVASGSGWGDFLEAELAGATVNNAARSGTSSKSFYDGGRFDAVRSALAPGDYVLIQFGHNDSKPEAYRRTEPGAAPDYDGTYREYLERYIDETRAAGATPILVTSVSRMVFGSDGRARRTHGDYPAAMRAVANDHGVTLLDLEAHSFEVFDMLGEAETVRLYAEEPDRTHFPLDKAFRVTEMVTTLLAASTSPLRCYLSE